MCAKRYMQYVGILATLSLVGVFGCNGGKKAETNSAKGSGDIVVGEFASMTGSEATFGISMDNGIQLATEEVNAAGGINGRKVSVPKPEDTESNAPKAETCAKRLIDKGLVAALGEVSSSGSLAAAPVCQAAMIPMISPCATNPKVTEVGDYIFRTCFTDDFQATVVATFAAKSLKAKTAAAFYDAGQAYSVGFKDEFEKTFTKLGGKIVKEASYTKDDKDFKSALTLLQSSKPDVILVPGYYSQTGPIAKQARDLGITVPLLGGDGWDSEKFFQYAGTGITNCFFSNHMSADDPDPKIQKFVKNYKAKYGSQPDALAALGYDAALLLYDAMHRAKSLDGKDLQDAIAKTRNFHGVTGDISINAQRNAVKPAVIIEVAGDKFRYKETIKP